MEDARSDSNIWFYRHKPLKALVAAITLVAFLFNTVSYDLAWAAQPMLTQTVSPSPFKALNVDTFALPGYMGTIRDSWSAPERTTHDARRATIIHIQDAHCNYYAQKKISEIIEYINAEYGVNTVNMEGGAKDYDLSPFAAIADKYARERAADYFVKEGLANGAEYFTVNNPGKVSLWGIEDVSLYIDNLNIYRNSIKHKNEIDRAIKSLSYILTNLKMHIYSKELLEFDAKYIQYKAGNMEFRDYLGFLMDKAKANIIDIKHFNNIYLLSQALGAESGVDFKKANDQRDVLIDKLQKTLSRKALEGLLEKTVEFKMEKISQKEFYAYLLKKADSVKIGMEDLPELQKYVVYVSIYGAIDKTRVMEETDALENAIKDRLYQNDTQKELAALSKDLALTRNLFGISMTRGDYNYYKANEDSFAVSNYLKFIEKEAPLYKITAQPDPGVKDLDSFRQEMSAFYEYSLKRDNAFMKNIRLADSVERIAYSEKLNAKRYSLNANHAAILITGGFHSDNLTDLFKKANISYISIMPNFRNPDGYECPYYKLLSGETRINIKDTMAVALKGTLATPDVWNPEMMREMGQPVAAPALDAEKIAKYGIRLMRPDLQKAWIDVYENIVTPLARAADLKEDCYLVFADKMASVASTDGQTINLLTWMVEKYIAGEISRGELEFIIAHEVSHIKNGASVSIGTADERQHEIDDSIEAVKLVESLGHDRSAAIKILGRLNGLKVEAQRAGAITLSPEDMLRMSQNHPYDEIAKMITAPVAAPAVSAANRASRVSAILFNLKQMRDKGGVAASDGELSAAAQQIYEALEQGKPLIGFKIGGKEIPQVVLDQIVGAGLQAPPAAPALVISESSKKYGQGAMIEANKNLSLVIDMLGNAAVNAEEARNLLNYAISVYDSELQSGSGNESVRTNLSNAKRLLQKLDTMSQVNQPIDAVKEAHGIYKELTAAFRGGSRDEWEWVSTGLKQRALALIGTIKSSTTLSTAHKVEALIAITLSFPNHIELSMDEDHGYVESNPGHKAEQELIEILKIVRQDFSVVVPEESKQLIWKALAAYETTIGPVEMKKLRSGIPVVTNSFRDISQLKQFVRTLKNTEVSFSIVSSLNSPHPIIIICADAEYETKSRLDPFCFSVGHSHQFSTPILASEKDKDTAEAAGKLGDARDFIIAMGRDGHIELASYSPGDKVYHYERSDQRSIRHNLWQLGMLFAPKAASHAATTPVSQAAPAEDRVSRINHILFGLKTMCDRRREMGEKITATDSELQALAGQIYEALEQGKPLIGFKIGGKEMPQVVLDQIAGAGLQAPPAAQQTAPRMPISSFPWKRIATWAVIAALVITAGYGALGWLTDTRLYMGDYLGTFLKAGSIFFAISTARAAYKRWLSPAQTPPSGEPKELIPISEGKRVESKNAYPSFYSMETQAGEAAFKKAISDILWRGASRFVERNMNDAMAATFRKRSDEDRKRFRVELSANFPTNLNRLATLTDNDVLNQDGVVDEEARKALISMLGAIAARIVEDAKVASAGGDSFLYRVSIEWITARRTELNRYGEKLAPRIEGFILHIKRFTPEEAKTLLQEKEQKAKPVARTSPTLVSEPITAPTAKSLPIAASSKAGKTARIAGLGLLLLALSLHPAQAGQGGATVPGLTQKRVVTAVERSEKESMVRQAIKSINDIYKASASKMTAEQRALIKGIIEALRTHTPRHMPEYDFAHVSDDVIGLPDSSFESDHMLRAAIVHEALHLYYEGSGIKTDENERLGGFEAPEDFWQFFEPGEEGWVLRSTQMALDALDHPGMLMKVEYDAGAVDPSQPVFSYDSIPVTLTDMIKIALGEPSPKFNKPLILEKRQFVLKALALIAVNKHTSINVGRPVTPSESAQARRALQDIAKSYKDNVRPSFERVRRLDSSFTVNSTEAINNAFDKYHHNPGNLTEKDIAIIEWWNNYELWRTATRSLEMISNVDREEAAKEGAKKPTVAPQAMPAEDKASRVSAILFNLKQMRDKGGVAASDGELSAAAQQIYEALEQGKPLIGFKIGGREIPQVVLDQIVGAGLQAPPAAQRAPWDTPEVRSAMKSLMDAFATKDGTAQAWTDDMKPQRDAIEKTIDDVSKALGGLDKDIVKDLALSTHNSYYREEVDKFLRGQGGAFLPIGLSLKELEDVSAVIEKNENTAKIKDIKREPSFKGKITVSQLASAGLSLNILIEAELKAMREGRESYIEALGGPGSGESRYDGLIKRLEGIRDGGIELPGTMQINTIARPAFEILNEAKEIGSRGYSYGEKERIEAFNAMQLSSVAAIVSALTQNGIMKRLLAAADSGDRIAAQNAIVALLRQINVCWRIRNSRSPLVKKPFSLEAGGLGVGEIMKDMVVLRAILGSLYGRKDGINVPEIQDMLGSVGRIFEGRRLDFKGLLDGMSDDKTLESAIRQATRADDMAKLSAPFDSMVEDLRKLCGNDVGLRNALDTAVTIVRGMNTGKPEDWVEKKGYVQGHRIQWHEYTHIMNDTLVMARTLQNAKNVHGLNIPDRSVVLAAIGALYHDTGYHMNSKFGTIKLGHEDRSIEFVRDNAKELGITDPRDIEHVINVIRATKVKNGPVFAGNADIFAELNSGIPDKAIDGGIRLAMKIIAVADVYDTRPNGISRIDDLYKEFTDDAEILRGNADPDAAGELAGLMMPLPTKPGETPLQKTDGFYKFVADKRANELDVLQFFSRDDIDAINLIRRKAAEESAGIFGRYVEFMPFVFTPAAPRVAPAPVAPFVPAEAPAVPALRSPESPQAVGVAGPVTGAALDSIDKRSEVVLEAEKNCDRPNDIVKVVVGMPDGAEYGSKVRPLAINIGKALAKKGYGIVKATGAEGGLITQEGDMRQIVPFLIIAGDPDATLKNYREAVRQAEEGLAKDLKTAPPDSKGCVVAFAPQGVTGGHSGGMTVVSDAYIDCDVNAEKKAFPDVMLRIQLARKIAFYYNGGDQEKALGDINDILEKVVDGYERVSTIDALLAITLRIRPVDYKTFDEWRRTIELLATSA